MAERRKITIDGNSAAAYVAHATNEVIAIYPITPSSVMGEIADEKSARGEKNIWGTIPKVVEMQSEGGASGAVHGSVTAGALTTTFTASQGLLLMIPNMFKIAGELTPTVFHVSARAIATHALSIFGEHSDVMATRTTGFGLIASANPQEVMDLALVIQAASLESRIPFVHFFDGFRTSHEIRKVEELTFEDMKKMLPDELIRMHRERALNPEKPVIKGTSQNPDVFFQSREAINEYYDRCPQIVQKHMDRFYEIVGRRYNVVDYVGHPEAEKVIVIMGSGADVVHETVEYLVSQGEKVGLLKIRLFRPFPFEYFINALPKTVKKIACLDRTKEPGTLGEPLFLDVRTAVGEAMYKKMVDFEHYPLILGGRYGLGSKDFTPAMVKGVFDNLDSEKPIENFSVGIKDDRTFRSVPYDPEFKIPMPDVYQAMFYGLGSDGTVGANKNSIKIIGELTDNYVQGYFVYDSKKAGSMTISHLRFGKKEIRSSYLIQEADFVGCHNFSFLEKYDILKPLKEGGVFLLNSLYGPDEVWDKLPAKVQEEIIKKKAKFYTINAVEIAERIGLGGRINVIMQTAFFKIANIIPIDTAVKYIKEAIKKTYGKRGEEVVQMNWKAVDEALVNLHEVKYPEKVTSNIEMKMGVQDPDAPEFVKKVTSMLIANKGDEVPVSYLPDDGTYPTGTTKYEKRNIAVKIPVWDEKLCTQCGICAFVCPHAAIRMKIYDEKYLEGAPETFKYTDAKGRGFEGLKFTVQIAPEDCTGCGACIFNCPGKDRNNPERRALEFHLQPPLREQEAENFKFFLEIPELEPDKYDKKTLKGSQLATPLFEFSGACAGCGETPYVKLLTQLFGDRAMIANATGCSSIYGGNLPTTPYCKRKDGRGPTWSNSLFEDNAEFGFGMRLAVDRLEERARLRLNELRDEIEKREKGLVDELLNATQNNQFEIEEQRKRVIKLKELLKDIEGDLARDLENVADYLIKKSVWLVGGDGWAYDIGYGGLDHVIANRENVNILVLDTEVYSNTGGQSSKSTPLGASAKFAYAGKPTPKKDLGMMAMTYGHVYVAQVSLANPVQCIRAFVEAESYDGPSLIIAQSHCIAHGIDMMKGVEYQRKAVNSGIWPLYRFDPRLAEEGKNPLQLDTKRLTVDYEEFVRSENRFRAVKKTNPENYENLIKEGKIKTKFKYNLYKQLSTKIDCTTEE